MVTDGARVASSSRNFPNTIIIIIIISFRGFRTSVAFTCDGIYLLLNDMHRTCSFMGISIGKFRFTQIHLQTRLKGNFFNQYRMNIIIPFTNSFTNPRKKILQKFPFANEMYYSSENKVEREYEKFLSR